jgi:hypothetical protein
MFALNCYSIAIILKSFLKNDSFRRADHSRSTTSGACIERLPAARICKRESRADDGELSSTQGHLADASTHQYCTVPFFSVSKNSPSIFNVKSGVCTYRTDVRCQSTENKKQKRHIMHHVVCMNQQQFDCQGDRIRRTPQLPWSKMESDGSEETVAPVDMGFNHIEKMCVCSQSCLWKEQMTSPLYDDNVNLVGVR